MQPVEADRAQTASVSGSDLEWEHLVDCNVERVWRLALSRGLSQDDAAQVSQLAWLRLSQRIATLGSADEVAAWLDETVRREADGLLRHRAAREGSHVATRNVIPLSRDSVAGRGALGTPLH
jgi:DNA-directed RNA polymerase specialized sigma24 family protein